MSPFSTSTRSSLSGLLVGFTYPLRALRLLIRVPRLRRYVLLPILLNLVLGVTLYAGLLVAGFEAIDALLTAIPGWIASASQSASRLEIQTDWIPTLPLPSPGQPNGQSLPSWLPAWPQFHLTWPFLPNGWASVSWPQIPWPQISWPQISWPQISWPQISWPQISWPQITIPHWVTELPEFGLAFLIGLLRFVLVVILLLVTGFILLQFGVLLGAPWYGQLSEELEKLQTGQLQTIAINPAQEIWRAIVYELKKLVLTLGIGIPLLIGNFFPGIGTIVATIGGIALAATIICLDFLDSTLERRRLRFRQKLNLIRQSLPASASFALVCLGLVSIPFLNLLAIPICVAAGTLFACDRVLPLLAVKQDLPPEKS